MKKKGGEGIIVAIAAIAAAALTLAAGVAFENIVSNTAFTFSVSMPGK